MPRTGSYTYNPQTGEWSGGLIGDGFGGKDAKKEDKKQAKQSKDNLTASVSDKNTASGSVEKQYNNIELNTLEGTLNFIVTEETIQLKAGDTVTINNIGKFLSGDYYVKDVTRQISSNGYSHTATLIKTDFGNSLKMAAPEKVEQQPEPSPPEEPQRTYTVKKGDCLWNIAKKFYGSGSSYGKIYDANTKQIADPHWIYPGQVFVIP